MQYNFRHQRWKTYFFKSFNNYLFKLTQSSTCLSKLSLTLIPLLLSYSVNGQTLSAITMKEINGSEPYLTFDNGVTKATDTNNLLSITISDGTTQTTYTPENNTSTMDNPIVLPVENQSFADIDMLVPPTTDSITLNELIGAPNNYWRDDDGDGQEANGISATGNLSVTITDKLDQAVNRNATLDICSAPYKVVLTSTDGHLTTQYGVPNSSSFSGSSATYYINPKVTPKICYARPNLKFGTLNESNGNNLAGPATIWSPTKGFLVQSIEPSTYNRNFPTTGANNLYFDLLVGGLDAAKLTWPAVSQGGITATITVNPPTSSDGQWGPDINPDSASSVRVTLTGPVATTAQINSDSPGRVNTPSLPQQFELVGYDSSNKAVLKYGFVLKQWFVNRKNKYDTYFNQSSWCNNLGGGYRMPQVKDLTNAKCGRSIDVNPCDSGVDGAKPSSSGNYYQRNIGAGFFTEWGSSDYYIDADFAYISYWAIERDKKKSLEGSNRFTVYPVFGGFHSDYPYYKLSGICTYP